MESYDPFAFDVDIEEYDEDEWDDEESGGDETWTS